MLYADSVTPKKKLSPIDMIMQNPELLAEFEAQAQASQGAPQSQMPPQMGMTPQAPQMAPEEPPMPQGDGMPMLEGYLNDEDYGRDKFEENQPQKKLGLLGRIKQQAGGSQALLALGSQLLSSDNFFDGLGKGAMAYQQTLDAEKERIKPKTQYLANGAFEMTYDPVTGKSSYQRTPIAQFEQDNLGTKLTTQEKIATNRINGQIDMNNADNDSAYKRLDRELKAESDINKREEIFNRWKVNFEAENAREVAEIGADGKANKAPPAGIVKQRNDYRDKVSVFTNTSKSVNDVIKSLESGELKLNLANNLLYKAQLATGVGVSKEALAYQRLMTTIETVRNAKLQANVGVQTDGDAERSMNEILYGKGDSKAVAQALRVLDRNLLDVSGHYDTQAMDLEDQYGINNSRRSGGAKNTNLKAKYGLD
jgi:exonuclease VII small subunit